MAYVVGGSHTTSHNLFVPSTERTATCVHHLPIQETSPPVEMPCSNVIRMPESVWTSTTVAASESVVTLFTSVQIACPWPIQPMIAIPPTAVQSGSHSPHNQLPTPVKLNKMLPFLNLYPGRQDAYFLVNGFSFGFRLWHEGP